MPDEHRQAAGGGDDQRLAAARRAASRVAVADQQVGEDGGQLPEDVEQEQVVGEDQAEHRAGERDQGAANRPRPSSPRLEVPGAVDQHQRADAGDQQREGRARARRAAARSPGRAPGPTRGLAGPRHRRSPRPAGRAPTRTRRPGRAPARGTPACPTTARGPAPAPRPAGGAAAVRSRVSGSRGGLGDDHRRRWLTGGGNPRLPAPRHPPAVLRTRAAGDRSADSRALPA